MKYKACEICAKNVGVVNIVGNMLMILIKAYMGFVGQSKGLIADAIHSSADLLATIVMIIGIRISDKKEDEDYPYGYGKAEYIVSIIIYVFLFLVGIYIVYEGVMTIVLNKVVNPSLLAVWGAIFSIAINELMFRQSLCAGTQVNRPSMVAKAWESRSDVYSSIAVLGGILGAKMGFHFMDPLAAIVVGIIILKISVEMVKESIGNLLDRAFEDESIQTLHAALEKLKDVLAVREILAREMGRYLEIEIDLVVPADISVGTGERIKQEVKNMVSNLMDRQSTIKVRLLAS